MLFVFEEEQKQIQAMARTMAEEDIAPNATNREEVGEYPLDVVESFRRHGIYALFVPEEYGGTGYKLLNQCIVMEETSRVCNNAAAMLSFNILGFYPLVCAGSDEQKANFLPLMAKGELLGAYGLTEPEAGSDAASMATTAFREGDTYIINGAKCFISHFDVAGVLILFARSNLKERPSKSISAFIVEKPSGTEIEGFNGVRALPKMGMRAVHTYEFYMDDLLVPAGNMLGNEGGGFSIAMKTLDRGRVLCAAQGIGTAQGALDYALQFTKVRKQFGKPVASFQGIQFMLADMVTDIEAARLLTYKAASVGDESGEMLSFHGAMAKRLATDTAMKVTCDAVQLLGGYGYIKDHPVERLMRDAKAMQIYEGTNQIQRLVIARQLLGRL